jgi:hypothetical protein
MRNDFISRSVLKSLCNELDVFVTSNIVPVLILPMTVIQLYLPIDTPVVFVIFVYKITNIPDVKCIWLC